jgi:hypothetical protein
MKSGSLNFLEPSGPVKVCNGMALPYHLEHLRKEIFFFPLIFLEVIEKEKEERERKRKRERSCMLILCFPLCCIRIMM